MPPPTAAQRERDRRISVAMRKTFGAGGFPANPGARERRMAEAKARREAFKAADAAARAARGGS